MTSPFTETAPSAADVSVGSSLDLTPCGSVLRPHGAFEPRTADEVRALARRVGMKRRLAQARALSLLKPLLPPPLTMQTSCVVQYFYYSFYAQDCVYQVSALKHYKLRTILETAARVFGLRIIDFVNERRSTDMVKCRQACMYVMKKLTKASYPMIGNMFNRDHTTTQYGVKCVERNPAKFSHLVDPILAALGELPR